MFLNLSPLVQPMKAKTHNSKQTDPSVIDNDGLSWNEDYKGIRPNQDSAIASNIVAELPLMLLLLPPGAEGAGGGEPEMPGR